MKSLKVAASLSVRSCFDIDREVVNVLTTDFCDVGAAVVSVDDVRNGIVEKIKNTGLKLPIFVSVCCEETFPDDVCSSITGVFELCGDNTDFYGKQVETAISKYEQALLPPFFGTLKKYVEMGNSTFACPGHQGGQFVSVHFRTSYSHLRSRDKLCTHHNRRVIWQSELTAMLHSGSN